jgi:SH3-like domain-containing protein
MTTRPFFTCLALLLCLAACNLPQAAPATAAPDANAVASIVAQTLQAMTPSAMPQPQATPAPAFTATPNATITPTYSVPALTMKGDSNCRSGPGQQYKVLTVLRAGTKVEALGRSSANNYWVVKNPNGGECWVTNEFATTSGSIHSLPTVQAPPTPTVSLPAAPRGLRYDFACSFGAGTTVNLYWQDAAIDEQGYRLYRDGALLAELPANSAFYSDTVFITNGSALYRVDAFNATGGAPAQVTVNISCSG